MSQHMYMYTYTVTYVVPHGTTIIANTERSKTMSRACPLPRLIRRRKPRHQHQQFCKIQLFQLYLMFSTRFDLDFPYSIWINVFDGIQLRFYQLNSIQGFWLGLTQFYQLDSTNGFRGDLTQFFSIWFDSCLTHIFMIRVTSFESYSIKVSRSPTLASVSSK